MYNAFIDTGSQCSMVRSSIINNLNGVRESCLMKIKGLCGGFYTVNETTKIKIELDNINISVLAYVVNDMLIPTDFLLGQDIITNSQSALIITPERVYFENKRATNNAYGNVEDFDTTKLISGLTNKRDQNQLNDLLQKYKDVFARDLREIGKTDLIEAKIELYTDRIVAQSPYRNLKNKSLQTKLKNFWRMTLFQNQNRNSLVRLYSKKRKMEVTECVSITDG